MTATYTLYGARGSGAAIVEAALALLGVPFRGVDAASWEPGPGRDELARVNPLVQIPTLVLPDGSVAETSISPTLAVRGVAVVLKRTSVASMLPIKNGRADHRSATAPATWGLAMLVPLSEE